MVAVHEPAFGLAAQGAATEAIRAFARLFSAICRVPSVQRVLLSSGDGALDLWVLLRAEAPEDEERLYLLERDYRQAVGAFPPELHVLALGEIAPRNLPTGDVLFER
jgi:hypothetical protein